MKIQDLKGEQWESLAIFKFNELSWHNYKLDKHVYSFKQKCFHIIPFLYENIKTFLPIKGGLKKWKNNQIMFITKNKINEFLGLKNVADTDKTDLANILLERINIISTWDINVRIIKRYIIVLFCLLLSFSIFITPILFSESDTPVYSNLESMIMYFFSILTIMGLYIFPAVLISSLDKLININRAVVSIPALILWPIFVSIQSFHFAGIKLFVPDYLLIGTLGEHSPTHAYSLYVASITTFSIWFLSLLFSFLFGLIDSLSLNGTKKTNPKSYITYYLISVINEVEIYTTKYLSRINDKFDFLTKPVRCEIENIANCVEDFLYKNITIGDIFVDSKVKTTLKSIAMWLREKNYILVFKSEKLNNEIAKELSKFLITFMKMEWHDLSLYTSNIFDGVTTKFNIRLFLKYLILVTLLLIATIGLDFIPIEDTSQIITIKTTLKITFIGGVVTLFVGIIEMLLGKELPSVKKIFDNINTFASQSSRPAESEENKN